MKVPFEWLKEYVTVRVPAEALASHLTMAGLEVVGIERLEGEPVLDLEVTPNRADCLSIIGIAREVAAITGQRLKLPQRQATSDKRQVGGRNAQPTARVIIRIEDRRGCERYIGRLIEQIRVGPSPAWMQRRLTACGLRPISNVVDITNYVLLEYGQPLHAFDLERLAQGTILVRRAQTNESITTLDGISRKLSSDMLVIADAKQPVAVAGIMGGSGSEVTPQTRHLLLESARFDPVSIRRTARKLGLASDSSYRFERGVDPAGVEAASARAAALLQELAGGVETAVVDSGTKPLKRTGIILDTERASRWLGMPLAPTVARTTLARLSCHVASSGSEQLLHVGVPSFRQDLTQEIDLTEELARLVGYDRVPALLPTVSMTSERSEESAQYARVQSLRGCCAALGLTEAITWSLVSEGELIRCGYAPQQAARLVNPLSQDHAYLRPSLLIGLLHAVRRNLTQGAAGVGLFELGRVVSERTEQQQLGIILSGVWARDWRTKDACDFFRLKGLLAALVGGCSDGALAMQAAHLPWAEPSQSTAVRFDGGVLGVAGQVARALTQWLDLTEDVWFAELSVSALLALKRARTVHVPSLFPPVKRDLSVVVGDEVTFEAVDRLIRRVGGTLASRVELIDRYTGQQVPEGRYSLTVSIDYRAPSRTLTAEEVDAVHRRIGETLVRELGAQLR